MLSNKAAPPGRSREEGEKPFWISYADLMTALMILFLVIMVTSLVLVTQKIREATQDEEQRVSEISDLCRELANNADLKNKVIQIDCKDNRINFGEAGRFGTGQFKLSSDGENALLDVVPLILQAANSEVGNKWFKQVLIEGFTDTDGSYLYNLNLSLRRSEWVMCTLIGDKNALKLRLDPDQKIQIKKLFLAGGVAFNNSKSTKDASRRVELRLQFYGLKEREDLNPELDAKFSDSTEEKCFI
ncbi:OmpA family protein [Limnobacter thiooxidans]|uniref:OmpA family protein n=1 Tax=Limnobacter thiooxidans TaxID=131080 RepID=A0AA86J2Z5_9BURK|nr:OmpA family protein [Limnobacter thiooxidans]BET27623.1 OmpA family protein [Limnobacter thiooxidans]